MMVSALDSPNSYNRSGALCNILRGTCIAPIRKIAKSLITYCGQFGRIVATLSPFLIPKSDRAVANLSTCNFNSS